MNIRNAPPSVDERVDIASGEAKAVNPHRGIATSEVVRMIYSEYQNRLSLTQNLRNDEEENHKIYTGANFGQTPQAVLDEMKKSKVKRDLSQFNFTMKKIDGLVGDIIQNSYAVDYISTDGEMSDTFTVLKDLFYFDKEICDWDTEFATHYTNGAIKSSWLQMYPDYRHNAQYGNIGVKALIPGSVLPDINWTSNNSGDCKSLFTSTYMTLEQIKTNYPKQSKRIDQLLLAKQMGQESTESIHNGKSIPRFNLKEQYNQTYRVIQYHHMRTDKGTKKTALANNNQILDVPNNASEEWFTINNVNPEYVLTQEQPIDVYYLTTIIPEIDMHSPLEDKRGLLQSGRLPFYHWSYSRHNGENTGAVDLYKDPQRYVNKMYNLSLEIIANSKHVTIADPGAFDNDVMTLNEVQDKFNTPGEFIWGKEGFSLEYPNAIQESKSSNYAGNELDFANNIMNMTDRLTPQSASMEGIGNERSGKHFDYKREQGDISKTVLRDSVRRFYSEFAEGYFYASQALYGGLYRKFNNGETTIEINVPTEDGRIIYDIRDVARAKAIISESPDSVSRRINDRIISLETLQIFGNQDPIASSYALESIFESMDNVSKEKKKAMKEDQARKRELYRTADMAQLSQNELMIVQTQMQKQQMANPQPQMPQEGAEGGQPPVEGGEQLPPELAQPPIA